MPGFPRLRDAYDVVIVGGGHAGLHAGVKTAMFRYSAAILDRGPKYSRSFYAPRMDNIPGSPDAISGHALLDRQIAAVRKVDDRIGYFTPARALAARRSATGFEVDFEWLAQRHTARGRALVLAMGVVDRMPDVAGDIEAVFTWANLGLVSFCLFCDAHEFPGLSVAVLGHDTYAARSAIDLLQFEPKSVELLTNGHSLLGDVPADDREALLAELGKRGIPIVTQRIAGYDGLRERRFDVRLDDGSLRSYDRGFSALGWYDMHQEIPRSLGGRFDTEGYVVTDEDCRVLSAETGEPIPGLYCIGDQRNGWNQIPEAWATAERAIIHAYGYYL
ncbi:MAG: FAD-dependent oxidoreductase [Thermoplasmata archaeon]|nr:FAD-dependent oxidoreductase [Thermoplasmata archaeon]